ncbi:O-antigen ligase family protein [Bacteroides xylanisolvens]|jgi:O-antigen ligase|uniref:O-antigen ligase family protein n=1 Tax=Bacteroides TaxID=816 RepID=UPI001C278EC5|nr:MULTISPECIES: O-antigen ligase family protein [Bacteroides]MBU9952985.1 O-antigen ligase family protein [Bacteroides sp. MSK.20.12]MBV3451897.1 O-antigen ligase family protein [Bacteroides xylanisolvens]MBV4221312.1 O-antigen ligase family protein [Bacteroides xylanisolvens]MDB0718080.1 O-antigen ligase family protein [Bacteroides xylanisolvens]MDB0737937.1 O-antigen ligase family protein [Bacteroides xylanisolvens]
MAEVVAKEVFTFKNGFFLLLCMCSVASYLGGPICYALLVLYSLSKVFRIKGYTYNIFAALFILIAIISTLVNLSETEAVFKPGQRIVMLILVMIVFSPVITNRSIYAYRKRLFIYLLAGLSITSFISSVLGLLGKRFIDGYLVGWYDFPNSLGYAQGLTIIALASLLGVVSLKLKLLCIGGILVTIVAIPLTGTRTAFYSIPLVMVGYAFLKSRNIKKLFQILAIVIAGGILFLNYVDLDTSIIDRKNKLQEIEGSSRDALWKARMNEYEQSPIIGIGTFRADMRWSIVNKNGNVEAGNSFLMMLSMNGLLGFVNFCLLYLGVVIPFCKYILKKRKSGLSPFEIMLSLVITYNFISMQQTGLLLNVGLYFTGINWLTLSLAYKINRFNTIN